YGTCFKEESVIKYPIESVKIKDLTYVVDEGVRQILKNRFEEFNNNEKAAFADLAANPLWFNKATGIKIRTVRMFTGLTTVVPVRRNEAGKDVGFVQPGNNRHTAFYVDEKGKKYAQSCTFWHGVERK